MFGFFHLPEFFRVYSCCRLYQNPLLWLNNIPLWGHTTFYSSLHHLTDRHLGGFYILAVVTNTAMKIHVHGFVWANVFISFGGGFNLWICQLYCTYLCHCRNGCHLKFWLVFYPLDFAFVFQWFFKWLTFKIMFCEKHAFFQLISWKSIVNIKKKTSLSC